MGHSAEFDALLDGPPSSRHAFWGIDPSGYCNCEDCEPTRVIPPEVGD